MLKTKQNKTITPKQNKKKPMLFSPVTTNTLWFRKTLLECEDVFPCLRNMTLKGFLTTLYVTYLMNTWNGINIHLIVLLNNKLKLFVNILQKFQLTLTSTPFFPMFALKLHNVLKKMHSKYIYRYCYFSTTVTS